jgi:hypothetical protein
MNKKKESEEHETKRKSMRHRPSSGWKQQVRKGSCTRKEEYGRN